MIKEFRSGGGDPMTTYDITVTREGKWWMVDVPAIDGLTQARRLSEIRDMAVSLIAITEDVPASQVAVNVVAMIVDGIDLVEQRGQIDAEREAARDAERKVAELTVDLVRKLNADHVPLRDIGEAVGVSFQRVHQLLNA
jgi:hypothetical protein